MSLQNLAKELEKKGRGSDRMLVHMTPKEVQGLQAIAKAHGGSLTINPETGLAEAGFLKNIMPMIIGAGITAATGGAAAPWMIGLGYGGFEAARTGDISKGLMAGLGAYGGAGLAGSLAGAGGSALATPEAVAGQLGTPAATTPGSQAAMLAEQNAGFGVEGLESIRSAAATAQPTAIPQFDGSTLYGTQSMGAQAPLPTYGQQLSAGANQVTSSPDAAMAFGKQNLTNIGAAAAPLAAGAMEPKPIETKQDEYKRKYPELTLSDDFRGYTPQRPNPYYTPRGLGYTGYAQGGGVGFQNMPTGGLAAIQGLRDGYDAPQTMDGNIPQFNEGKMVKKPKKATRTSAAQLAAMDPLEAGLAELNNARAMAQMPGGNFALPKQSVQDLGVINAAQGRYLKGPGDGMSDSIAATINNKQPARLADGEFVVPADVVSHLGNGSSDAGAKKLYKMMDKVRVARTGKKQQAPAVKTDKFMLA